MTRNRPPNLPLPLFALGLTHAGLWAERLWRGFWPFLSVLMLALAPILLGLHELVPVEWVWAFAAGFALALVVTLVLGLRRFRRPSRDEALSRLDAALPGRPIQTLLDEQAVGAQDPSSAALWRAHQSRMAARVAKAEPVAPDLVLTKRDPYGLRFMAALCFVAALLFGSVWRVGSVADLAPGAAQAAAGPSWEGWIEPPRYTGLPTLYLNDQNDEVLQLPQGSRITLRFYGELGQLRLAEDVSGKPLERPEHPEQTVEVTRSGPFEIEGRGGRGWQVVMLSDNAPQVEIVGAAETQAGGKMVLPFAAMDDYGITGGRAIIALDIEAVDRRHGLRIEPEPRDPVVADLPLPITGDRREFTENLIEDFSQHPWAHLPVTITLIASDAAGQEAETLPFGTALPARRFFDPLAGAVIEQRRDLLWSRDNAPRVAQILRAISHRPDEVFRSQTAYLRLRVILRRMEALQRFGLKPSQQEEIAQALWDLAIMLEDGTLSDALERMRRAQERLSEAMKNGASDEEIAELMQELREATQDYLRQLAQNQQNEQDGERQAQEGESLQMTQDDLQKMMDRIQELMEQGRMAEAQQALEEFQQMMENMRVTQGQGDNGQSEGQRAMEGLAETLRNQQGLSDQAFRDLQEQFNPGAQAGESQQNEGRNGGQGRGQSHEGEGQGSRQSGTGQDGAQQGEPGETGEGSLAERQQALRNELGRQEQNLPGQGTPEGDAAREALDRAGRAMEGAEEALRENDLAEAIDRQAEAMEAMREGMRSLGEALAQQSQPGQGSQEGDQRAQSQDPLGRTPGSQGGVDTDEALVPGDDVYRRARDLLDEIRRRSGESDRPKIERDYLKRLLDRF